MRPRHVHPSVFLFLILPFGAMSGYLTVSLAWVLTKAGVPLGGIAALIALSFLPHTWKFLWAPIVDLTLTRKRWYMIASVVSAAGMLTMGALPATVKSLALLSAVVLVSNIAVTFLGMSVDSLMAYGTAENEKGRAGGWFQAGNLGGAGLGGGAGLWMTQHLSYPWLSGAILAAACLLCALALPFVYEPPPIHRERSPLRAIGEVGRDVWSVVRHKAGFLALLICFLPIGTGAASQLWSGVAGDWHATADTVALVTGTVSGVLSMVGCLMGGWISDRMNRKWSYAVYGLLQAGCAVAMGLAPRTQMTYIVYTSIYAVISGMTYAGFTAVTLEAIGTGAAATKYNVYASLSNQPIAYMTTVDAWGHKRWGPSGMLNLEAICCLAGISVYALVAAAMGRRRSAPGGLAAMASPADPPA